MVLGGKGQTTRFASAIHSFHVFYPLVLQPPSIGLRNAIRQSRVRHPPLSRWPAIGFALAIQWFATIKLLT